MDISKSEQDVMRAIWQGHPCSAQDVIDRLNCMKSSGMRKQSKPCLADWSKKGALRFEKGTTPLLIYTSH